PGYPAALRGSDHPHGRGRCDAARAGRDGTGRQGCGGTAGCRKTRRALVRAGGWAWITKIGTCELLPAAKEASGHSPRAQAAARADSERAKRTRLSGPDRDQQSRQRRKALRKPARGRRDLRGSAELIVPPAVADRSAAP